MLTIRTVADELGISYHTLRRLLMLGRIPGVSRPVPGRWHLLTRDEVSVITQYVRSR